MEAAARAQRSDDPMMTPEAATLPNVRDGGRGSTDSGTGGDGWIALAIGALTFGVYASGACRTIYVGDSGELVAAVHVLGVPHPTGYPLYVLLGKLWTLAVAIGSIAFRMSLFSAACAAVASALLYGVARRMGCGRLAALFASLLAAFAPSFWGEANVQRVYALNAVFVIAAIWAALEWWQRRQTRMLLVAVFTCAVGATNHTFMALLGLTFGAFALIASPRTVLHPRALVAVSAVGVLGLLPYAYLPIASSFDPPLDWGNPETLAAFLDVVLRRDFWERAWLETPADLLPIGIDYVRGIAVELAWVGAALAAFGVWASRRSSFSYFLLATMAVNVLAMALHGSRSDLFIWHRYYIPSYLIAALFCGLGVDALAARWGNSIRFASLALPVFLLVSGWTRFDRSDYRIADDFSRQLLATLPPGASLSATDDNVLFVLIYLKMVEGVRPDVDLILQGVAGGAPDRLRFDPEKDPLYFSHHPNWDHPELDQIPVGLAFRVWRRDQPLPKLPMPPDELPAAADPGVPRDYLTDNLVGQYYFMLAFTAERDDWNRAAALLERAMREAPNNDVLFYNAGLIYERNGRRKEALDAFRRSHAINPRHIPGTSRARAWDKIVALEAEAID